jgi:hypothetical protein
VSWFGRKAKKSATVTEPATLEGVSSIAQNSLRSVHAAVSRCSASRGRELVAAWRELLPVVRDSVTVLIESVAHEPQGGRLRRIARLTVDELWEMADPWLDFDFSFVAANHIALTSEELSTLQRIMWSRAEAAITAYAEGGGKARRNARVVLRRIVDQAQAPKLVRVGTMSERQVLMWKLAAEEITAMVSDRAAGALAR